MVEIQDPFSEDVTDLVDELLVNLHQLDKVLCHHLHVGIYILDNILVNSLRPSVVLPIHLLCDLDSLIFEVGSKNFPYFFDMHFAGLKLHLLALR